MNFQLKSYKASPTHHAHKPRIVLIVFFSAKRETPAGIRRFAFMQASAQVDSLVVRWPHGAVDRIAGLGADRFRFSVDTATAAEAEVPEAALHLRPYPNPFRRTTTLGFTLPRAARVEAQVYDVTGRAVRTLVDEWLPGGEHHRVWDGLDAQGP